VPEQITLLKFTASWCGPCQTMKPTIKAFTTEHPDVIVREIDVDTKKGSAEADTFHVRAIPTMIMMVDDKKVWRTTGTVGRRALENALTRARAKPTKE